MTLPLVTHLMTIWRPDLSNDDIDDPDVFPDDAKIAEHIGAVISSPSGREDVVGGNKSVEDLDLIIDNDDLRPTDIVQDEATGAYYNVRWVQLRLGLGLNHTRAGIRIVRGMA